MLFWRNLRRLLVLCASLIPFLLATAPYVAAQDVPQDSETQSSDDQEDRKKIDSDTDEESDAKSTPGSINTKQNSARQIKCKQVEGKQE